MGAADEMMGMGFVSHVCEEFHGLTAANEVAAESIQAIVDAMVLRQPLASGVPSNSHIMWLRRETTKLLTRHAELLKREICVARREALVSGVN